MVCISLRYSNLTQYDGLNVSVFLVPEKRFFQEMINYMYICFVSNFCAARLG